MTEKLTSMIQCEKCRRTALVTYGGDVPLTLISFTCACGQVTPVCSVPGTTGMSSAPQTVLATDSPDPSLKGG